MHILVYSAAASYWLIDGNSRSRPPDFSPSAELVFSISDENLPRSVAQMLESAIGETGMLELRECWADYVFHECSGWRRHKRNATSALIG